MLKEEVIFYVKLNIIKKKISVAFTYKKETNNKYVFMYKTWFFLPKFTHNKYASYSKSTGLKGQTT